MIKSNVTVFNHCKSTNVIHCIYRIKEKIIWPVLKSLRKLGKKGNFLNTLTSIYKNLFQPSWLKMKYWMFSCWSKRWQGCSLSSLPFNIVLKILANAVRRKKRRLEKYKKPVAICRWHVTVHRNSTGIFELLEIIKELSRLLNIKSL